MGGVKMKVHATIAATIIRAVYKRIGSDRFPTLVWRVISHCEMHMTLNVFVRFSALRAPNLTWVPDYPGNAHVKRGTNIRCLSEIHSPYI